MTFHNQFFYIVEKLHNDHISQFWKLLVKIVMSFDPFSCLDNGACSSNRKAVKNPLMLAFSHQLCKCKNDISNCVVQSPLNATLVYKFLRP